MNRLDILNGAEQAVAQRGENYGSPKENFGRIAKLWTAYKGIELSVEDVGVMMMLVKLGRLMENPHHQDSWVDIAGYSAITAEAIAETLSNQPPLEGQQSTASN